MGFSPGRGLRRVGGERDAASKKEPALLSLRRWAELTAWFKEKRHVEVSARRRVMMLGGRHGT